MNREQARAAARKGQKVKREPVMQMKRSDIEEIEKEMAIKAVRKGFDVAMLFTLNTLHDKHGFTPEMLEGFAETLNGLYESFNQGYIDFEDLRKTLKDETGINIEYQSRK